MGNVCRQPECRVADADFCNVTEVGTHHTARGSQLDAGRRERLAEIPFGVVGEGRRCLGKKRFQTYLPAARGAGSAYSAPLTLQLGGPLLVRGGPHF